METSPDFVPFDQVLFKGVAANNGQVVNQSNAGYMTIGGQIDTADANNDGLIPYFGAVVSSPTDDEDNLFTLGCPSGYVPRGFIMFDAKVAQDDPAKSSYILPGLPMSVVIGGRAWYQQWGKTQSGAIDPVLGCLIIFNATDDVTANTYIGAVEFLPEGSVVPDGWAAFPGSVTQVNPKNGVQILSNFPAAVDGNPNDPGTPLLSDPATLTAAAAATPVVIIPDSDVGPGKKFYMTGFILKVNGATAWTDVTATIVTIEDTAGADFAVAAKAQLTGNAALGAFSTGITLATAVYSGTGGGDGKGVQIKGDANFAAGSNIIVQVFGFVK